MKREQWKERLQDFLDDDLREWMAELEDDEDNYDDQLMSELEEVYSAIKSLIMRLEGC